MPGSAEEKKLFKIGEVCRVADVQPYVLRYWETEFPPLAPNKSGGGQRLYTQHEIDVILRIKQLLYAEGFTIAGAKKKLEAEMISGAPAPAANVAAPAPNVAAPAPGRRSVAEAAAATRTAKALLKVKKDLQEILRMLQD